MDALEVDLSELWGMATGGFALGLGSLHGPDHWQRVERNALLIAPHSGANILVVRLFAVLHDSMRLGEGHDPEHGQRAADWARELREARRFDFFLSDAQFSILQQACIEHDKGLVSQDPTIGTCWDADRLDLLRVGIAPAARLMSTGKGKLLIRGE